MGCVSWPFIAVGAFRLQAGQNVHRPKTRLRKTRNEATETNGQIPNYWSGIDRNASDQIPQSAGPIWSKKIKPDHLALDGRQGAPNFHAKSTHAA